MIELQVVLPLRGCDNGGDGAYGATRGTDSRGMKRYHRGIDFNAAPKSALVSPINGYVTKLGFPYSDDLTYRYVQVQDAHKNMHRFFYVDPDVEVGEQVFARHTVLGYVQDVSTRYPKVEPHIHYEIKDQMRQYVNPEVVWAS